MKKLICLLAAAALLVCCALPAFAEASGVSRADYTITAYSVDATLHENNTVTQTERITVDFAVPSRGIYRVLPVALWVEKDTADGPQEMAYRARVRDLAVTGEGQTAGAPVETDTEDGFYSIRIGDEDTWLTGVQTYELTFTYDIGDDRVAAYDELFYSLNGGRWDAPIEDFRFSFTFEKPLTQEQKGALALYSGSYGGKGNEAGVSGAWDGNTFSGAAGRTLYPGEAVTLYARLPEGYFTGERMAPVWVFWAFAGAGALLAAYTLLRALSARRRAPVVTPECTPPDGVSSAEVGYIIDNSADDRDILSLILWFASKGYLAVEGREELLVDLPVGVILHHADLLGDDAPLLVHAFLSEVGDGDKAEEDLQVLLKVLRAVEVVARQGAGGEGVGLGPVFRQVLHGAAVLGVEHLVL